MCLARQKERAMLLLLLAALLRQTADASQLSTPSSAAKNVGPLPVPAFISRPHGIHAATPGSSQASASLQQQQPQQQRGSSADFLRARAPRSSRLFAQSQDGSRRPRILCTGLGVVSAAGIGVETFWNNLLKGVNNAAKVSAFDAKDMASQVAYEISSDAFDPKQYFREPKDAKRNDRYTQFAVAASKFAMEDAGLGSLDGIDMERFGVVIGSGIGGLGFMEQQNRVLLNSGPRRVSPYLIPAMIANTAPAQVAIEIGAKGPNHGAVSACATSGHAIGTAMRLLQSGDADIVLCGGAEASITPLSFAGFNALKALALGFNDRPKEACRPFDKNRSGFVMGEGAGYGASAVGAVHVSAATGLEQLVVLLLFALLEAAAGA
ncbi:3-oxoacyl-[acyl-carrier-protein] synthase, related [Eimeria tenella]|uniref:Nodulation protein E n=1 Tax=Eimeria tenella TaxID=5802 RepID=U6L5A5_EIMTE|nr:3-oxoacyl-[acyl-carrier-protein] synthase, related [Eimeria tenella]CDJ42930.1 3-oxoacyl-[acyl-carrier-protein] synthase, related [Eimeria tenella]|eukprot:XP_013233680.1 3-oxoacyl-[acyl-carrier-protein] synthase, related [Eimeria tenella]